MKIKNTKFDFSYKKPPKIIAEISGNHNGSKSRCFTSRHAKEAN